MGVKASTMLGESMYSSSSSRVAALDVRQGVNCCEEEVEDDNSMLWRYILLELEMEELAR